MSSLRAVETRSCGRLARLAPLLAAALALLLYLPTLRYALVWDDLLLAQRARDLGLTGIFPAEFRLQPDQPLGFYRPLVLLSFLLDGVAGTYHLTNVLLHAACTALVVQLAGRLGLQSGAALVAGLLFAVHPVHVEAVAFVSGRTDVLAALFVLGAAILQGRRRMTGSAVLWGCGLLCKETAAVWPAPALLWLLLTPGSWKERARRAARWCLAWAVALTCVMGLRLGMAGVGFGSGAQHSAFISAAGALLTDLRLLLVPWPLRAAYTPDLATVTLAGLLAAAALVTATAVLARTAALRLPSLVGAAWILAFLLPSLGLISIHALPVAERFLYLPSVGVVLLAGATVVRVPFRLTWAVWAVLILGMAAGTVARERVWREEVSLFRDTVRRSPRYATGHAKLGAALLATRRTDEAFDVLARAWDSGLHDPEIAIVAGVAAASQGQLEAALRWFAFAERRRPDDAEVAGNVGAALLGLGRTGEAVEVLRKAAERHAARADLWDRLGVALQQSGRPREAIDAHARALALRPGDADFLSNCGHALLAAGRAAEAKERFRTALAVRPDDPQARFGWILALARTGELEAARNELPALRAADPRLASVAEREIRVR